MSSDNADAVEGTITHSSHGRPRRQAAIDAENSEKNRIIQDKLMGNAINKAKYCTAKVIDDLLEDSSSKTVYHKKVKVSPSIVTDLTNSEYSDTSTVSVAKLPHNAFFLPAKARGEMMKHSSLKKGTNVSGNDTTAIKKKELSEEEKLLKGRKVKEEKEQLMAEKFQLELMQKRMNESQSFAKSGRGVNAFFMQQQGKTSYSIARRLSSENNDNDDDESEDVGVTASFVDIVNCPLSNIGSPNIQEYMSQTDELYTRYPLITYRRHGAIDLTTRNNNSSSSSSSSSSSKSGATFEDTFISQVPSTKFDLRAMCDKYMSSQKLPQTVQPFLPNTINNGSNIATWSDHFSPKSKADMIGNVDSLKEISEWLGVWAGKRRAKKRAKKKRTRMSNDFDFEEPDILSNLMIICGPSGSGITSSVFACAKEIGYNIIEINASQTRSGSIIKKSIAEATQSNGLGLLLSDEGNTMSLASSNVKALNLILFDEIDIVFDDDTALYSTIQQLVKTSKCPIILTTQSQTTKPIFKAQNPKCITFSIPESVEVYEKLKLLLSSFNIPPCVNTYMNFLSSLCFGDLRSCFNSLQFLAQSGIELRSTDGICDTKCLSFSEWILDQKYDVAYFDSACDTLLGTEASKVVSSTASSEVLVSTETAGVVVPIIFSSSPKKGSILGGYVIRITGKHFLQRNANSISAGYILDVNVFISGILCESQIESDTSICAKIPALSREGVHVISITVGSLKGVSASSESCGSSGGWLNAYDPRKDVRVFFGNNTGAKSKKPKKSTVGTLPFTVKSTKIERPLVLDLSNSSSIIKSGTTIKKGKLIKKNVSNTCILDDDDMLLNDATGLETSRKRKNVLTDDEESEEVQKLNVDQGIISQLNCEILRIMKSSVEVLLSHRCAEPFALPVDTESIFDYLDKINEPMDLGTIQESLALELYALAEGVVANDLESFVRDVRLIWSNCRLYNGTNADITRYANILSDVFEENLQSSIDILKENIALEIQNTSQSVDSYVRFVNNEIILANSMNIPLIGLFNDSGDDLFDGEIRIIESDDEITEGNIVESLPDPVLPDAFALLLDEAEGRRRKGIRFRLDNASAGVECLYYDDETISAPIFHRFQNNLSRNAGELECVEDMSSMYAQYSDSDLLMSCNSEFFYLVRSECADATSNDRYLYSNCVSDASGLLQHSSTQILKSKVLLKSRDHLYCNLFERLIDVKAAYIQKMDNFSKLSAPSEETIRVEEDNEVINVSKDGSKNKLSRLDTDMDEDEFASTDDYDSDDCLFEFSANNSFNTQVPKCDRNSRWHTSYSFIDSPYIRFTMRKSAYIRFVTSILTNFETGAFDNNNLSKAVCRELALDYIPFVGLILHADAARFKFDEPSSVGGRSQTRLKSRKGREKYVHLRELFAGMSEQDLDKLVDFSFVECAREIGDTASMLW